MPETIVDIIPPLVLMPLTLIIISFIPVVPPGIDAPGIVILLLYAKPDPDSFAIPVPDPTPVATNVTPTAFKVAPINVKSVVPTKEIV